MTFTQDDLTWMFKDPDWENKFLVGSLLALGSMFVPFLGIAATAIIYGYALSLMRRAMRGEPRVLPKWDDYGAMFVDGGKAILSAIVYFLPGIIIFVCGYLFLFGMIFGSALAETTRVSESGDGVFVFFILIGQLGFFVCFAIGMLVYLVGFALAPVAVGQYLRTGQISAGYRWAEVWRVLRANLSGFLIALIMYYAIAYGLGFVVSILVYTIVLCLFIPFLAAPITFYVALLYAQFFGAAYREGALKAGLLTA